MHLLADISAHGLGHLAQTAPVLNALAEQLPALRLTVRSALSRERLTRRIHAPFTHLPESRDFGYVMFNAVDIDLIASAQRYREFHIDWAQRVRAETEWLEKHQVDALLSNVAYLPLAAAADAGIVAAGMCSLNWADMFAHYFKADDWTETIHQQMLAAYNAGRGFLRVTPGLPMDSVKHCDVSPIAQIGQRDRRRIAQLLKLDENERWVLLAMGGMEFRLPVERWPQTPGITWLLPGEWAVQRDDMRSSDVDGLSFGTLLASVDAVVTKPGYGTFVEAACSGIPILYLRRDDWPETPYFAAWLDTHARVDSLTREQLLAGNFIDVLQSVWQMPAPCLPQASGAREAADWLRVELGLS